MGLGVAQGVGFRFGSWRVCFGWVANTILAAMLAEDVGRQKLQKPPTDWAPFHDPRQT